MSCRFNKRTSKRQTLQENVRRYIVRIIKEASILSQKIVIFLSFLYLCRKLDGCDDISPQTSNHEQTIPQGLSTNTKANAVPSSQELMPLHLVKNMAYADKIKHPPPLQERSVEGRGHSKKYDTATDQEMSPAQSSSGEPTYSHLLHQVPHSFDTSNCEWESEYSKLNYKHLEKDSIIENQALTSEA